MQIFADYFRPSSQVSQCSSARRAELRTNGDSGPESFPMYLPGYLHMIGSAAMSAFYLPRFVLLESRPCDLHRVFPSALRAVRKFYDLCVCGHGLSYSHSGTWCSRSLPSLIRKAVMKDTASRRLCDR